MVITQSRSPIIAALISLVSFGNVSAQETRLPDAPPAPVAPETQKPLPTLEYVQMTIGGSVSGDIILELNREKAPISTENFLSYVDKKHFEGLVFHRVIATFMIQGGGFTPDLQPKPTDPPIKNEWKNGLKNARGTIAMARTGVIDSATSQFFINVVDNAMLDQPRDGAAYAVFGKVVAGMNIVDAIKVVPVTNKGGHQNVPVEAVLIKKAVRLNEADAKKKIDAETSAVAPAATAAPVPPAPSAPATPGG